MQKKVQKCRFWAKKRYIKHALNPAEIRHKSESQKGTFL